jgi:hypothetical protein
MHNTVECDLHACKHACRQDAARVYLLLAVVVAAEWCMSLYICTAPTDEQFLCRWLGLVVLGGEVRDPILGVVGC